MENLANLQQKNLIVYFPIRGGSRKAIAKNSTPIPKAKTKIYATLSISSTFPYIYINYQFTS